MVNHVARTYAHAGATRIQYSRRLIVRCRVCEADQGRTNTRAAAGQEMDNVSAGQKLCSWNSPRTPVPSFHFVEPIGRERSAVSERVGLVGGKHGQKLAWPGLSSGSICSYLSNAEFI